MPLTTSTHVVCMTGLSRGTLAAPFVHVALSDVSFNALFADQMAAAALSNIVSPSGGLEDRQGSMLQ